MIIFLFDSIDFSHLLFTTSSWGFFSITSRPLLVLTGLNMNQRKVDLSNQTGRGEARCPERLIILTGTSARNTKLENISSLNLRVPSTVYKGRFLEPNSSSGVQNGRWDKTEIEVGGCWRYFQKERHYKDFPHLSHLATATSPWLVTPYHYQETLLSRLY